MLVSMRQIRKSQKNRVAVCCYYLTALLVTSLLAGCGAGGGIFGSKIIAGIPDNNAAFASKISMKLWNDDSGTRTIFHRGRDLQDETKPAVFEFALKGTIEASSGQEAKSLKMFVTKDNYGPGYFEITDAGGNSELWPIIAFDHKGEADGVFDFIYLLASPTGTVHYLLLSGGEYKNEKDKYFGFQGTFIKPGLGNDISGYEEVKKINLGLEFPYQPIFIANIELSGDIADDLKRSMKSINSMRIDVTANKGKIVQFEKEIESYKITIAALQEEGANSEEEGKQKSDIEKFESEVAKRETTIRKKRQKNVALESEIVTITAKAAKQFSLYFSLRADISNDFSRFIESNYYSWKKFKGQLKYWDKWQRIEQIANKTDEAFNQYLVYADVPAVLKEEKKQAVDTIENNNNSAKRPVLPKSKEVSHTNPKEEREVLKK